MVVGEVTIETDVVIIGGGPGGYVAAIRAAELGLSTVLVERDAHPGGVCLHRGCIPSKALLAAADLAYRARNGGTMGIHAADVSVEMATLHAWQRSIVDRLARGVSALLERHGVTVVRGEAVPAGRNRVAVAASHGAERYVARRGIVIATGAMACPVAGLHIDGTRVLAATDALFLDELPSSVAIVGADYVAVELAVAFRKLGSAVALLGAGQSFLPEVDTAVSGLAERGLKRLGIAWYPEARPLELTETALRVDTAGDAREIPAAIVIVSSSGRSPNVADLGLDLVGVTQDETGLILVDERQRTSVDGIYAVGDVTLGLAWAHRAYRQGKVAAEVIAGHPAAYDPRAVPSVVLAEPELASAGLGEEQALLLGYDALVSRFPWAASGRALTLGLSEGQTVVVSERGSGVVLGVHIAGQGAGELIGEAMLAMEMGATLEDIAETMHPHPTRGESIMEAAELAMGLPTHIAGR
jgi:dihydrolipoamide dehydrogenase